MWYFYEGEKKIYGWDVVVEDDVFEVFFCYFLFDWFLESCCYFVVEVGLCENVGLIFEVSLIGY